MLLLFVKLTSVWEISCSCTILLKFPSALNNRLPYDNTQIIINNNISGLLCPSRSQTVQSGFANFIDEWSHCDVCFTNFGVILEYLTSSIRTKKAIFRLSSTWSWHVFTIVRDTRSTCGGTRTGKAQIHDGGHQVHFDRNFPSSRFVVRYNSLILMI